MELIIVDIQNSYRNHIDKNLYLRIIKFSQGFSNVYYLYDKTSDLDLRDEIPFEFLSNNSFYNSLIFLTKKYGFFRKLMDCGVDSDDEIIIKLVKFLKRYNLKNSSEIFESHEIMILFKEEFKNTALFEINLKDYPIYLPVDLINSLLDLNNVVLVGGGRNECLKEVAILLKSLEINFRIEESLTY